MTSNGSEATDSAPQSTASGSGLIELNERLGNAVNELYQLLELYAPAWYTEELHTRAEVILLAVGKVSSPTSRPQAQARACRVPRD